MDVTGLKLNVEEIRGRISRACERSGRDLGDVKLVGVSKTHPAEAIRSAIEAGVSFFGENKVQEAEGKVDELGRSGIEWHLIGHLQSNKARKAVRIFDVVHTVDSIDLAQRLERLCDEEARESLSVFVQVDLALEQTKAGITEDALPELVSFLKTCMYLRFDGLMILPPFFDDAEATRPYFRQLRAIRDRLASEGTFSNSWGELSMGMSHDFEVAIEEGSTVVRVGTAIFGARDYSNR